MIRFTIVALSLVALFCLRAGGGRLNPSRMLSIELPFRQAFSALGLKSFDSIVAHFSGGQCPNRTTVFVKPLVMVAPGLPGMPVFYKQYEYVPAAWGFVGRASKAQCEFKNYDVFGQLGIPCAERVACGESRDGLGRLRRAFIITRAVPEAMSLIDFLKRHCPDNATATPRKLRPNLLRQLATLTGRMHAAEFFHNDLVWRNILVTWQPPDEPHLWLIDCPRGRFRHCAFRRRHHQLKDLALLDKSAARFCTRAERVAFVREYLGLKCLNPSAKRLIRDALDYRKRRWPEDWDES